MSSPRRFKRRRLAPAADEHAAPPDAKRARSASGSGGAPLPPAAPPLRRGQTKAARTRRMRKEASKKAVQARKPPEPHAGAASESAGQAAIQTTADATDGAAAAAAGPAGDAPAAAAAEGGGQRPASPPAAKPGTGRSEAARQGAVSGRRGRPPRDGRPRNDADRRRNIERTGQIPKAHCVLPPGADPTGVISAKIRLQHQIDAMIHAWRMEHSNGRRNTQVPPLCLLCDKFPGSEEQDVACIYNSLCSPVERSQASNTGPGQHAAVGQSRRPNRQGEHLCPSQDADPPAAESAPSADGAGGPRGASEPRSGSAAEAGEGSAAAGEAAVSDAEEVPAHEADRAGSCSLPPDEDGASSEDDSCGKPPDRRGKPRPPRPISNGGSDARASPPPPLPGVERPALEALERDEHLREATAQAAADVVAIPPVFPGTGAGEQRNIDHDGCGEKEILAWRHWTLELCKRLDRVMLGDIMSSAVDLEPPGMDCNCVCVRENNMWPLKGKLAGPEAAGERLPQPGDYVWYRTALGRGEEQPYLCVRLGRALNMHHTEYAKLEGFITVERMVPDTLWWRLAADVNSVRFHICDHLPHDVQHCSSDAAFWDFVYRQWDAMPEPPEFRPLLPQVGPVAGGPWAKWAWYLSRKLRLGVPWTDARMDSLRFLNQAGLGADAVRILALRWRHRGGRPPVERPPRFPPPRLVDPPTPGAWSAPAEESEAQLLRRLPRDRPVALLVAECARYQVPGNASLDAQERYEFMEAAVLAEEQKGRVSVLRLRASFGWLQPHLDAVVSELAQVANVIEGDYSAEAYYLALLQKAGRLLHWGSYQGTELESPAEFVHAAITAAAAARWAALSLSPGLGVPVFVVGRPPGHHASACPAWQSNAAYRIESDGEQLWTHAVAPRRNAHGGCFIPVALPALLASAAYGGCDSTALIDVDVHMPDGYVGDLHAILGHLVRRRPQDDSPLIGALRRTWRELLVTSSHTMCYPWDIGLGATQQTDVVRFRHRRNPSFAYSQLYSSVDESYACPGCGAAFPSKKALAKHTQMKRKQAIALRKAGAERIGEAKKCTEELPDEPETVVRIQIGRQKEGKRPRAGRPTTAEKVKESGRHLLAQELWHTAGKVLWEEHWQRAFHQAKDAKAWIISLGLDSAFEEDACTGKSSGWGFGETEFVMIGRAVGSAKAKARVFVMEGGYAQSACAHLGTVIRGAFEGVVGEV
eukprot:TRINITY_DN2061_c0_g2_i1.p1 TRINITY_DN2061_c0_g2~~TRINITY_DN2061_c0_g2_i1.p1  ORF type:complete len:1240 (+),score=255.83 TRINITY_DN2061_c0_g2_i1:86-3721(+)